MTADVRAVVAVIRALVAAEPTLVFGNGRCYAMFAHLRRIFGVKARPFYDGDHVTTEIDGHHYDSRGLTISAGVPMALVSQRAVSQMRRNSERQA